MKSHREKRIETAGFWQSHARSCQIWALIWMVLLAFEGAMAHSKDVMDLNPEDLKSVQVYSTSMYLQTSD